MKNGRWNYPTRKIDIFKCLTFSPDATNIQYTIICNKKSIKSPLQDAETSTFLPYLL